jgi:hypothetical protein
VLTTSNSLYTFPLLEALAAPKISANI